MEAQQANQFRAGEIDWEPEIDVPSFSWRTAPHLRQPMNPGSRWVSLLATRDEIELHTSCDCPPIPIRSLDWSAIDSNTYDCGDIDEDGSVYSTSAHGTGEHEIDAINDLFDQLEYQARESEAEPTL